MLRGCKAEDGERGEEWGSTYLMESIVRVRWRDMIC